MERLSSRAMEPPADVPPAPAGPPAFEGGRLLGASLLVLATVSVGRQAGATGLAALLPREGPPETDGVLLSAGILVGAGLGALVLWLLLRAREPRRYLAIERPSPRAVALALAGGLAIVGAFAAARWGATGHAVPLAWVEIARSAPAPLLIVAFALAAPCFEEAFFRGFLHTSLRGTRFGPAGAIALTAILFALAHGPEDALSLLEPLASAVFLGVLRERTGSIVPGIAAHAAGNLAAIATAAGLLGGGS